MSDDRVVARLRTMARQVLAGRRWSLGLEADDLIGAGWLAYRAASHAAQTRTYPFQRARYAMMDALRTWYGAQRVTESTTSARLAGRSRSRRAVRWVSPATVSWSTVTRTPDGLHTLADVTAHQSPAPSWAPTDEDRAALESRIATLPARPAAAIRLALAGETVTTSSAQMGCTVNAVRVARSVALSRLHSTHSRTSNG